ncbi:hypothetical protein EIN_131930 [Entamoeba invadens IP1]|uniref:Uncharacterized protein n=1 Tax=Entamoeba invadens IP1 TaxID=370355 RepID=A0A0A1UDB9_ENTIV|nr:hypothetical protein EIN_131930 [Entamoeba invadens IP1]ELP94344.1 hypothetical protein EIN_131930 [Entamoeba invadens IP1]|eukprot:XP_004261115.1 hypothetical protein EIN_131930 [Entamoeba invadens IP1]
MLSFGTEIDNNKKDAIFSTRWFPPKIRKMRIKYLPIINMTKALSFYSQLHEITFSSISLNAKVNDVTVCDSIFKILTLQTLHKVTFEIDIFCKQFFNKMSIACDSGNTILKENVRYKLLVYSSWKKHSGLQKDEEFETMFSVQLDVINKLKTYNNFQIVTNIIHRSTEGMEIVSKKGIYIAQTYNEMCYNEITSVIHKGFLQVLKIEAKGLEIFDCDQYPNVYDIRINAFAGTLKLNKNIKFVELRNLRGMKSEIRVEMNTSKLETFIIKNVTVQGVILYKNVLKRFEAKRSSLECFWVDDKKTNDMVNTSDYVDLEGLEQFSVVANEKLNVYFGGKVIEFSQRKIVLKNKTLIIQDVMFYQKALCTKIEDIKTLNFDKFKFDTVEVKTTSGMILDFGDSKLKEMTLNRISYLTIRCGPTSFLKGEIFFKSSITLKALKDKEKSIRNSDLKIEVIDKDFTDYI